MNVLLRGLLTDLLQRCNRLKGELERKNPLPAAVADYQEWVVRQLSDIESKIKAIQQDPDIDVPEFTKNFLHAYKRLSERVSAYEAGPVLAICRFSDNDQFLTMIAHTIANEINYPWAPPLCAALSSQHYWINTRTNIIMVPVAEPMHLLGLSDLYHELGHSILERSKMLDAFRPVIKQFFDQEIRKIAKENKPGQYREILKSAAYMWEQTWVYEFASDMIAAYLAGPAFGWANIRLCINLSDDLFAATPEMYHEHPADDARNEAICGMLDLTGVEKPIVDSIRNMWSSFIAMSGDSKKQDYEMRFPPQLITDLGRFVFEQCQKLNLKSYLQQELDNTGFNFTRLLNIAWMEFNNNSRTFPEWETQQLQVLRKKLML